MPGRFWGFAQLPTAAVGPELADPLEQQRQAAAIFAAHSTAPSREVTSMTVNPR